jgi:hypothetical protein
MESKNRPDWNTREGMMSEEEIRRLSQEKGKGAEGAERADQAGKVGPQPYGDAARRADQEGGPTGAFKRKNAAEYERIDSKEEDNVD